MIYNSVVPYGHDEIRSAVEGFLTSRDYVSECENLLYEMTGRYAVLVESGLAAILLYLELNEVSAGDEILLPAYMCQWVVSGLIRKGYNIKFVDVSLNYNMSIDDFSRKLTDRTKAVIAVHSYGIPCDIQKIKEILSGSKTLLIEDSAQSFGYISQNDVLGIVKNCCIFSFGWFKPVTAMGGGALISDDIELIRKARFSVNREYTLKERLGKLAKVLFYLNKSLYHQVVLKAYSFIKHTGINKKNVELSSTFLGAYRSMQNLQSSIAIRQFQKAESFNNKRIENLKMLTEGLYMEGIQIPEGASTYPLLRLPLFFENYTREKVMSLSKRLFDSGIEAPMLYPYLPKLLGINSPICLTAEKLSERTLHLPVHPSLKKNDIENIKQKFRNIVNTK